MSTRPVIIWFRQDLRLADNAAWSAAVQSGAPLLPVYIHDPAPTVGRAPGAAARWWLHHALQDLSAQLQALGHTLTLFRGHTSSILSDLLAHASHIHCNRTYHPGEAELLSSFGQQITAHASGVLFPPDTTRAYQVFTPFYRHCLTLPFPSVIAPAAGICPPAAPPPGHLSLSQLQLLPSIPWDIRFPSFWTPTRAWALQRLSQMSTQDDHYHQNRDFVAEDATSRLSPYLAWGQLGPREFAAMLPRQGALLRQLFWREFAIHTLFRHPHIAQGHPLRPGWQKFPWVSRPDILRRWQKGLTGHPLVDAGMQQLWQVGWMHNRARMVAASFLVKNALIPWQEGEAWFWDTLVDADLANNVFGWQWVAGCGADAAPYFRVFNPDLQKEKFDPLSAYARRWIPQWATPSYPPPLIPTDVGRQAALDAYQAFSHSSQS